MDNAGSRRASGAFHCAEFLRLAFDNQSRAETLTGERPISPPFPRPQTQKSPPLSQLDRTGNPNHPGGRNGEFQRQMPKAMILHNQWRGQAKPATQSRNAKPSTSTASAFELDVSFVVVRYA